MKTFLIDNFIADLDNNEVKNLNADNVGNLIFQMSLDPNHETNKKLKEYFEQQKKKLRD